jgi:hypothetical protein
LSDKADLDHRAARSSNVIGARQRAPLRLLQTDAAILGVARTPPPHRPLRPGDR